MILDLMHGDLTSQKITLQDLPKIIVDITAGLRDLHSRGFVHFDIRPGKFYKKIFFILKKIIKIK